MQQYFYQSKKWLTEALFPPKCPICYEHGSALHVICLEPYVMVEFDSTRQLIWLSRYEQPIIKKLIESCKFFGFTSVVQPWVESVPPNFFENILPNGEWTVVPVPLHWSRRLWRGFNQSEIIANNLKNNVLGLCISNNLLRVKKTKQQARLSKQQRKKNIQGAFAWKKGVAIPRQIILVDDVYTSGATLLEAKKTLLQAGAEEVWCFVLARKI
jgi:competence protein ComFC